MGALPSWLTAPLERFGVADLSVLQDRLRDAVMQRGQAVAGRAVVIGSDALDVVIAFFLAMYVLFFLLLDGPRVVRNIHAPSLFSPSTRTGC